MRLSPDISEFLKCQIKAVLPEAKIFLYGSRIDDNAKGGDIDVLILSSRELTYNEKFKIKTAFIKKYGEQKIDLTNFLFDEKDMFKELILVNAIEL